MTVKRFTVTWFNYFAKILLPKHPNFVKAVTGLTKIQPLSSLCCQRFGAVKCKNQVDVLIVSERNIAA